MLCVLNVRRGYVLCNLLKFDIQVYVLSYFMTQTDLVSTCPWDEEFVEESHSWSNCGKVTSTACSYAMINLQS